MLFARATEAWIGGSDTASEGNYVWAISGTPITFFDWSAGEPNGGTSQNCILLDTGGQWKDRECSLFLPAICVLTSG
jgi:hypothetical protein